jgi:primosomal protein N' (replication factor Y) (superfamily II helicase)
VPSFSVDGGFRYAVPEDLAVQPGVLVRIPLGGRRVRGYVLEVEDTDDVSGLKPIAALSGDQPVFNAELLETLRWAAHHYVTPLSTMLERAAPPNNPRTPPGRLHPPPAAGSDALGALVTASLDRKRVPPTVVLASRPPVDRLAATAVEILRRGRSTMFVTATTAEAETLFEALSSAAPGHVVIAHGDMPDRSITGAWSRASTPCILVGTPRVACWPVADLGAAVVIEEGRRAMKDRQTPTVHVRDILRKRAQLERFPLVVVGPTPTTEILATGPTIVSTPGTRLWGLVEVVDRRSETTGGSILTDPVRRALAAVTRRGGRTFVFGHRKGYSAATRCVACRTLRTCPSCGSRPDPGERCTRCGADLGPCTECGGARFEPLGAGVGRLVAEVGRIVGAEFVAPAPGPAPVVVGTERDVVGIAELDLVILPDLDGLLHGTNYRSAEDALRLGARLAGLVGRGSGRRMMVQTSDPEHSAVRALVKADPLIALEAELDTRRTMGYPPSGELIVIEVSGGPRPDIAALSEHADVLGPAPHGEGSRWLLTGLDLGRARTALRPMVQRWRDSGLRVRIDVDPIDL